MKKEISGIEINMYDERGGNFFNRIKAFVFNLIFNPFIYFSVEDLK